MSHEHADVAAYYEKEAQLRKRGRPREARVRLQDEFIEVLQAEGRPTVVDFGAGPGQDGDRFAAAGIRYTGLDLAHGNGLLAAERGFVTIQGSITAVPFGPASFSAGWSMSTLMHLDAAPAAVAVGQMVAPLAGGAPLMLGMWGCETEEFVLQSDGVPDAVRPFHVRMFEHNQAIVAEHAVVERADRWVGASGDWDYHVILLRTR